MNSLPICERIDRGTHRNEIFTSFSSVSPQVLIAQLRKNWQWVTKTELYTTRPFFSLLGICHANDVAKKLSYRYIHMLYVQYYQARIDPLYVSFIPRSQARLKCRERFTVKQVLGLIAAMILLLCINSLIVVTKSICYDTWGVVKLFNVYYKNSMLTCSPTWAFLSLLFVSIRGLYYDYVGSQRPTVYTQQITLMCRRRS